MSDKDINYWRGFKEINSDPDFLKAKEDEFIEGTSESPDLSKSSALSRRTFLALMASSAALAATGCTNYRDKGEIVPYNKKPEDITIGVPNFYASTCTACPQACGILIKTREGRPIKVDGNPEHPVNKGKICAVGQANIMNLYDPNRTKEPLFRTGSGYTSVNWLDTDKKIIDELTKASAAGKEIAVITHSVTSPTAKLLFEEFSKKYTTAKFYSYELVSSKNINTAFNKSYGKNMPVVMWNKAKVILSLESDFLGKEGNFVEAQRLYTESRDVMNKNGEFNKLYVVEGGFSLTGANSDYRIKLRTDAVEEFAYALIDALGGNLLTMDALVKKYNLKKEVINTLVEDLKNNKGESFVTAGSKLPVSTHTAVNKLNDIFQTNIYSKAAANFTVMPLSETADIEGLVNRMNSGAVGAVIHFDSNPVYHFSPDYKYSEALSKVGLVVTLAEEVNETSGHSGYHLPIHHNFEAWGDHKTRTGFTSLQQPVIAPIFNTRQKEAILLNWLTAKPEEFKEAVYLNYIKANWEKNIYPSANSKDNFVKFWATSLHDGVVTLTEKADTDLSFKTEGFAGSPALKASSAAVLQLNNGSFVFDGRFANNGWLQELPNPVTKVVWDNYAEVSPDFAEELGVKSNDMVEVSAAGKTMTLPVFVQPGMAKGVIAVELGYGRTAAGPIGNGVGVNTINLVSKNSNVSEWLYTDVKVSKAAGTYELVSTQEHYPIDNERYNDIHLKREIIREGVFEEYKKNPKFLKEEIGEVPLFNIVPSYDFITNKWAMSIDLNKCTGCNYCVAACNVENNIPVVGKEQVGKNREMMWMRIDRYYNGKSDDPSVSFQPMLCQHCDNAPCENVCPVAATNHSPDGLNQMAYNRCVGTRYCSNNCPYKVRRFNYFNFRDNLADEYYESTVVSLMNNPEVTVRSRGVMEKCTFCVQRIMNEKQHATEQGRPINGDNVITACQEACPTNAIVFGDLTKKESEIVKHREHELGYHVLEEINVRPNVTYIAKLRNIKPEKKA